MYKLPQNDESILFFEEYTKSDNYIPHVVAVLNKCGSGTLYFGVNKNGEAIGTKYNKTTISLIIRDFENNISPKIYPLITSLRENSNVLKIVFEGFSKPYNFKSKYFFSSC